MIPWCKEMDEQLSKVRKAYDLTVEQFRSGIDPYQSVPEEIRNTEFYKSIGSVNNLNSSAADIREFLAPVQGMRFLDAGCSANLVNYNLGDWPSIYYGVDISPALIRAMKSYAETNHVLIGGLYESGITEMPFQNEFFDIAAVIGVLEYGTLEYVSESLKELHRVLKPGARIVMDIPNSSHHWAADMQKLEEFLERPIFLHSRSEFEKLLKPLSKIERTDDSGVMIKYFVHSL
jgi:SAM-dependent methyltransferase